ncbi:hypothetical protein D3C81_808050 [compost metagenome]
MDGAPFEQPVVVGQFQCMRGRTRTRRRPIASQLFADHRLDRHRRNVRAVICLGQQVPALFGARAISGAHRAYDHAAAMFAELHQVQYGVEQP